MTTQNGFRSQVLSLIAEQRAKKTSIQRQLDGIDERIAALELTLTIHEECNPVSVRRHGFVVSPDDVRANGGTQMEALKFIARHNNGHVRYTEAKDILIAAGMTSGKARNVAAHLYNLMASSDKWERVSPGVFRLLEDEHVQQTSNPAVVLLPTESK